MAMSSALTILDPIPDGVKPKENSKVKKHGGVRPGAGRPPLQHGIMIAQQRSRLIELLEPHIQSLFAVLLARSLEGDISAIRELLNRTWGTPIQQVDVTSGGRQIFTPEAFRQKTNDELITIFGEPQDVSATGTSIS